MDQKKKQGGQGNRSQGPQQAGQQDWNQSQHPNRDQPEDPRQEMPGRDQPGQRYTHDQDGNRSNQGGQKPQSTPERGGKGERNSERSSSSGGGISNRGIDSEEEQEDVPERGFRQSER
jgi:hypothetical protein